MANSTPLPAPVNKLLLAVNTLVDGLVMGLGKEALLLEAKAAVPWLALPIISWVFGWIVNWVASSIDVSLKKNIDILIIRFQNDARKADYDKAITKLQQAEATGTEEDNAKALQAAKDAINALVHKSR